MKTLLYEDSSFAQGYLIDEITDLVGAGTKLIDRTNQCMWFGIPDTNNPAIHTMNHIHYSWVAKEERHGLSKWFKKAKEIEVVSLAFKMSGTEAIIRFIPERYPGVANRLESSCDKLAHMFHGGISLYEFPSRLTHFT